MNILKVDFQELYERHLCRHSQFGINVGHFVLVAGIYVALCGLLYALAALEWLPLALGVPYLAILFCNVPLRVFLPTVLFLALVVLASLALPRLPFWSYPIVIFFFYKLQAFSHRIFTRETDMTQFNEKYPKGLTLFVLLSIYEVPILFNYLLFGKSDWYARSDGSSGSSVRRTTTGFCEKAGVHANRNDSATV
jgi:hypothetical protein